MTVPSAHHTPSWFCSLGLFYPPMCVFSQPHLVRLRKYLLTRKKKKNPAHENSTNVLTCFRSAGVIVFNRKSCLNVWSLLSIFQPLLHVWPKPHQTKQPKWTGAHWWPNIAMWVTPSSQRWLKMLKSFLKSGMLHPSVIHPPLPVPLTFCCSATRLGVPGALPSQRERERERQEQPGPFTSPSLDTHTITPTLPPPLLWEETREPREKLHSQNPKPHMSCACAEAQSQNPR